jgi:uncharacterized C2H2 Zn-finger protein
MEKKIQEQFECEICHKIFKTKWNLNKHINKQKSCKNVSNVQYKCDNCGKQFDQKSHYNDHINRKTKCKPMSVNLTHYQLENILEELKELKELKEEKKEVNSDKIINETNNSTTVDLPSLNNNSHNNLTNSNNSHSHNNNSHNTQNTENSNNTMQNMNNSCLIQYVVNQYPNAKNIEDCIKIENIPRSTLTECEDLYFTDGAMKIFKGLCDLGEENRPIHCTDASRGNYIYKSNDVWKIDVGGEAIRNHFFPVIQEAYTQVHKQRIKNNPGNSTIIGNYLTEMTGTNVKKICNKTLKRLSSDFLAKNSKNSKLIKMQKF